MDLESLIGEVEVNGALNNRELVEIMVYHAQEIEKKEVVTAAEVRKAFSDLALPVPSRVGAYLSEGTQKMHSQYVKSGTGYKLHRAAKSKLDQKFISVKGSRTPHITHEILASKDFKTDRRHLDEMIRQINGTYTYGFYDGTAVLMRRLMETLLIESFEIGGKRDVILDVDGNYVTLSKVIKEAQNPSNIKFSRGIPKFLEKIKDVGDTAAHSRTYITKQQDIDNLQSEFRKLIDELFHKAGLF